MAVVRIPGARTIVLSGPAARIFLAVSALLLTRAIAEAIGNSALMSGIGELSMTGE